MAGLAKKIPTSRTLEPIEDFFLRPAVSVLLQACMAIDAHRHIGRLSLLCGTSEKTICTMCYGTLSRHPLGGGNKSQKTLTLKIFTLKFFDCKFLRFLVPVRPLKFSFCMGVPGTRNLRNLQSKNFNVKIFRVNVFCDLLPPPRECRERVP